MPTTLLLETNDADQHPTLRHQLLRLSMLALLLAPWALIAISLMALNMIATDTTLLLACAALVVAAIPGWLHFITPAQHIDQSMAKI